MDKSLDSEAATINLGRLLAPALDAAGVIFLSGGLGAGKTTLCRGLLRGLGYDGAVKSPTFTLVEPYELERGSVYHFDLYRLAHPDELDYLGAEDYFAAEALCLIEWPERGAGFLPTPDLELTLTVTSEASRQMQLRAQTLKGERAMARLAQWL
ncbi:MAG: tRNA (adenosine(37)-N6)-threonylcarbamoyltransferase complex ATPase subunit type 1 TsaE [Gammaproteobacteria bacterium TMED95]|nr:tRNA (adenosine(37)-N6)-threonylcarbamoyltransferase complex ATPase subunit type 1 TsaE [Gammaproteobacteria bacterium]OUV21115.1 MAG: tRNA (adenosine(37)-N6)-threonylcarbamoyltransferase complex ATPase subunit type 1 TsaE [Gammaproteobacteria bacterium TMED95]|tara:strand:- start:2364 stop:2825 length:462 start_codon:yes stop_codon:yes gene_type:complete